MKNLLKCLFFLSFFLGIAEGIKAQTKLTYNPKLKQNRLPEDSLFNKFCDNVYQTYYNSAYIRVKKTTITILKVDIDWQGKVKQMGFSDSADSAFVTAFKNKQKQKSDISTLEKYAKIMSLTSVSLIIPVYYEPNYEKKEHIVTYDQIESMMKFKKINFAGKSIIYPSINIPILTDGNM